MPSITPTLEYSRHLYRIWHRNALALHTKYASFFEVSAYNTLSETVIADTLVIWILVSVAPNFGREHIHLVPDRFYHKRKTSERKSSYSLVCMMRSSAPYTRVLCKKTPRTKDKEQSVKETQCPSPENYLPKRRPGLKAYQLWSSQYQFRTTLPSSSMRYGALRSPSWSCTTDFHPNTAFLL